jgi:hypothetical protein
MTDQLFDDWYSLLFGVRRSIRYHQRRVDFFERLHMVVTGIQIAAGSAAVAIVFGSYPKLSAWFSGGVAVLATIDLVVGTSTKARVHSDLSRRFSQLERDMVPLEADQTRITPEVLSGFVQRRLAIQEDEPPVHRMIDLLSHNELVRASYPHGDVYPISWLQRWLGDVFHLDVTTVLAKKRPASRTDPTPPLASS